jgi:hypothetical protein
MNDEKEREIPWDSKSIFPKLTKDLINIYGEYDYKSQLS